MLSVQENGVSTDQTTDSVLADVDDMYATAI